MVGGLLLYGLHVWTQDPLPVDTPSVGQAPATPAPEANAPVAPAKVVETETIQPRHFGPTAKDQSSQRSPRQRVLDADRRQYLEWAQYPPDSRPMTDKQVDILKAHIPPAIPMPLNPGTFEATDAQHDPTIFVFVGDKNMVSEGQAITLRLKVMRGDPQQAQSRIAVHKLKGILYAGKGALAEYAFYDDGTHGDAVAGDWEYSTQAILPADKLADFAGSVFVSAHFTYALPDGGQPAERKAHARYSFQYQSAIPLQFTGRFRENMVDGSLVVQAGIQVAQSGDYFLRALFEDKDGEPLLYADFEGRLHQRQREVPFTLFGRILKQNAKGGPYKLMRITGHLRQHKTMPPKLFVAPIEGGYTTRPHAVTAFSDTVWNGPEKTRRMAMFDNIEAIGNKQQ